MSTTPRSVIPDVVRNGRASCAAVDRVTLEIDVERVHGARHIEGA